MLEAEKWRHKVLPRPLHACNACRQFLDDLFRNTGAEGLGPSSAFKALRNVSLSTSYACSTCLGSVLEKARTMRNHSQLSVNHPQLYVIPLVRKLKSERDTEQPTRRAFNPVIKNSYQPGNIHEKMIEHFIYASRMLLIFFYLCKNLE